MLHVKQPQSPVFIGLLFWWEANSMAKMHGFFCRKKPQITPDHATITQK